MGSYSANQAGSFPDRSVPHPDRSSGNERPSRIGSMDRRAGPRAGSAASKALRGSPAPARGPLPGRTCADCPSSAPERQSGTVMTPDRWLEVKQAFEAVLQLREAAREDHLERMRASAPEIHREVVSLLAAHERAGSFLESGARISTPDEPRPPSRSSEDPTLPARTRLGAYEVVA